MGETPQADDNTSALDREQTLLFHHVRIRQSLKDQIKEMQAELKSKGNTAKAALAPYGYNLKDLDYVIQIDEAEDKKIGPGEFLRRGRILSFMGVLPGHQLDLWVDRAPALERIEADGDRAGMMNKPRQSGFQHNSEEDLAWLRGHDTGQARFNRNIEPALAEAARMQEEAKGKLIKKGKKTPPSAAEPIKGDKPPEAKKAAAKPAKPPAKPSKAEKAGDDGKTVAQREAQRQAEAAFKH